MALANNALTTRALDRGWSFVFARRTLGSSPWVAQRGLPRRTAVRQGGGAGRIRPLGVRAVRAVRRAFGNRLRVSRASGLGRRDRCNRGGRCSQDHVSSPSPCFLPGRNPISTTRTPCLVLHSSLPGLPRTRGLAFPFLSDFFLFLSFTSNQEPPTMSKHFCCCIPVRAGVFFFSLLQFLYSAGIAGIFWFLLHCKLQFVLHMPKAHFVSFSGCYRTDMAGLELLQHR